MLYFLNKIICHTVCLKSRAFKLPNFNWLFLLVSFVLINAVCHLNYLWDKKDHWWSIHFWTLYVKCSFEHINMLYYICSWRHAFECVDVSSVFLKYQGKPTSDIEVHLNISFVAIFFPNNCFNNNKSSRRDSLKSFFLPKICLVV